MPSRASGSCRRLGTAAKRACRPGATRSKAKRVLGPPASRGPAPPHGGGKATPPLPHRTQRSRHLGPPSAAGPKGRPGPSAAHRRHPALHPLRTAPAATPREPRARRRSHGRGNFTPGPPRRRSPAHPHGGEPRWRRKGEPARCLPGYGPGRTPPPAATGTA